MPISPLIVIVLIFKTWFKDIQQHPYISCSNFLSPEHITISLSITAWHEAFLKFMWLLSHFPVLWRDKLPLHFLCITVLEPVVSAFSCYFLQCTPLLYLHSLIFRQKEVQYTCDSTIDSCMVPLNESLASNVAV